jgi:membrane protein DedA with SNARE-associated domain
VIHLFHQHYNLKVVLQYLAVYGYGFVFLGTVLEGELILLAAGFLAYIGALNFWLVLVFGFFGATLGDNIWFWIGARGGTPFLEKCGKFFFLTKKRINKAKAYFNNHGSKTIFFSRFIFGTRISSAILAGALGMRQKKFLKSNVAGAGTWAIITVSLGYFFGNSFEVLRRYLKGTEIALLILAAVVLIILLLRFLLTSKDI